MTILAEFNRLKNIQNYLEKHDELGNFLIKYGDEYGILEYCTELTRSRQSDCELLQKTFNNIFKNIENNKNALKNQQVDDVRLFKNSMIEIQDNLHNIHIKLKRDLTKLEDVEQDLSIELEAFEKKSEEWSKPLCKNPNVAHKNKIKSPTATTVEVKEFHDFLDRNGGHYNNWTVDDHQLFLKIRKKYKNIDKIAENLHKILPDKTEDNIREHENWYKNYTNLKDRMKDSLKIWREQRDKTNKIQVDTDNDDKIDKNCQSKPNDEEIRTKIALWKMEKQAKYQQELEMETLKKQQLKQIELNKRRMNDEIKESVKQWKEMKQNYEENMRLKQEMIELNLKRQKAIQANKMIKKFQSQDDLYIMRKKISKHSNDKKTVERSKSIRLVDRDPERIFKPTQQWLRKTTKQDDHTDSVITKIPNIHTISKLKIPEWRKNI